MGLSNVSQLIYHLFSGLSANGTSIHSVVPGKKLQIILSPALYGRPCFLAHYTQWGSLMQTSAFVFNNFQTSSNLCGQDLDSASMWPMGSVNWNTKVSGVVPHRFGSPEPSPDLECSSADSWQLLQRVLVGQGCFLGSEEPCWHCWWDFWIRKIHEVSYHCPSPMVNKIWFVLRQPQSTSPRSKWNT